MRVPAHLHHLHSWWDPISHPSSVLTRHQGGICYHSSSQKLSLETVESLSQGHTGLMGQHQDPNPGLPNSQRLPTGVFHPSYHCVDIYSIRLSTSVYSHCMSLAPGTVPAWVTLGIRYLLDKSGHVVGSQLDAGNQDLTGFRVQFSWSLPSGEGIR